MLFFVGIYTLIVLGISQLAPNQGEGFIVKTDNGKHFYQNIGQPFSQDKYFWSRPSAVNYNAAGAGGSNKGPSNPEYLLTVRARIDSFTAHNPGIRTDEIPADLVTASGSGLDPDISVEAARIQVKRISRIRNIPEANLEELILGNTYPGLLNLIGPKKVNVLQLNLALDNLQ